MAVSAESDSATVASSTDAGGAACMWKDSGTAAGLRERRRSRMQQRGRARDHALRLAAVCEAQKTNCRGGKQRLAAALGVSPRTLRNWKAQFDRGGLAPLCRGRRPLEADVAARNEVVRFLHRVTGPAVGVAAVRALFPQMPRAVLAELVTRYRRLWRRRYRRHGFQLTWHGAGRVWAMDHSEAAQPVDGVHRYIFAIRDLASHRQLAWVPVATQQADSALAVLEALIAEYGPPLVLKSDNGSAFIAEVTKSVMESRGVAQLFSPAGHPQYNGGLERSNGTLKTYTGQQAAADGHPLRWTSDDLEQARQLANSISRPWGHRGPSPDEAWQARSAVGDEERAAFHAALAEERRTAAGELGIDLGAPLGHADSSRLDRVAIARVLEELGYLTKKRVVRDPKKAKRPTRDQIARKWETLAKESAALGSEAGKNSEQVLASPPADDTMRALGPRREGVPSGISPPQPPESAQREPATQSWWRRSFTLLVSIVKAAKISR